MIKLIIHHLYNEFCDLIAISILSWRILYSPNTAYFSSSASTLFNILTFDFDNVLDKSLSNSVTPNFDSSLPFLREISNNCLVFPSSSVAYYWNLPIYCWRSFICFLDGRYAAFSLSHAYRHDFNYPLS